LAKVISDTDIEHAIKLWKLRRSTRIRIPTLARESIFDYPVSYFRDRPIFVAIYRDDATIQAERAFEKVNENVVRTLQENPNLSKLSFFDQWDDLPCDNSVIISIHIGPRNGVNVEGIFKRLPKLDESYHIRDEKYNIQVVIRED